MSNTWDYRFAFRVQAPSDIPSEFRSMYDRLLETCGPPVFGLFSPAMEDPGFILSHWLPPKLILLFSESLAVLSLDSRSDQALTFELPREDFLGYRLAEFLLNCWFTLYGRPSGDEGIQIRFPSRAFQHFVEFARLLINWLERDGEAVQNQTQSSRAIPGLPPKFSSFLEAHTEFGPASEFFFQPATELRKKRQGRWANVLLLITRDSIVALTDQHRGECSQYGIEMTYFPLRRVTSVEWIESADGREAEIRICLRGIKSESCHSWPVLSGLKPYALRWSKAAESSLIAMAKDYNPPEASGGQGGEYESDSGPLQGRDSNHARSRSD